MIDQRKPAAISYRYFGSMRLFLAVIVMFSHATEIAPGINRIVSPTWVYGPVAVFAFFVISGFVICEAAKAFYDGRPYRFAFNRIIRLLIPYLLALILTAVIVGLLLPDYFPEGWAHPANLAANTLALFPFVPVADKLLGLEQRIELISIVWALRIEFAFYFVVLASLWLSAPGRLRLPAWILTANFAAFLVGHVFSFYVMDWGRLGFYLGFAPYFVLGSACALGRGPSARPSMPLIIGTAAVLSLLHAGFYPALIWPGSFEAYNPLPAVLWGVLCLALLPLGKASLPKFGSIDRYLGDLSYPIYLLHMPSLYLSLSMPELIRLPVMIGTAIAFSVALELILKRGLNTARDKVRGSKLPKV